MADDDNNDLYEDDDDDMRDGDDGDEDDDDLHYHIPHNDPRRARTRKLKANIRGPDDIYARVKAVFQCLDEQKIDLPIFLEAISWNPELPDLVRDDKIRYARTTLMWSEELPIILTRWRKPPRKRNKGITTKAAFDALNAFALKNISTIIRKEMKALQEYMLSPIEDLSQESLLAIEWEPMIADVKKLTPTTWDLFREAAYTPQQSRRNILKTPDDSVVTMLAMAAFTRSHHSCKLQKMLTIYFKSCGLANKAFDTLHALGITMSQKWAYLGLERIAQTSRLTLLKEIKQYRFFGAHDNLNIPFHVYEQRMDNQTHFDSGTASSIFVVKDPAAPPLDSSAIRQQWAVGAKNPITAQEILDIENASSPRTVIWNVYRVLQFLLDSPAFEAYPHKHHAVFAAPPSILQLPTGPQHAACAYLLDTLHVEEASYEGNIKVFEEIQKQLNIDTLEERKRTALERVVPWCGDQLTISRMRGIANMRSQDHNGHERGDWLIKVNGWFHTLIAFENSLHTQYYGTRAAFGLHQAFDLLNRKGLQSTSIKGTFHHSLQEGLYHIADARFRDLWCIFARVESLDELLDHTPDQLYELAARIITEAASTIALDHHKLKPEEEQDDLFYQCAQWNRDILDYICLDEAIKSGDVGRMQDMIPRLLFRFLGGSNNNYTIEVLEMLQAMHREWTPELRDFIMRYCWLINTTGRAKLFSPVDLAMEHNIRDIKGTMTALGPYVSWDYIGKMSGSIPCQRRVKDHVEAEINHYRRGKSHTSPDKEKDIIRLQDSFRISQIQVYTPGRTLEPRDKFKDYIALGSDTAKLHQRMKRWLDKRIDECSTRQEWFEDTAEHDAI